MVKYLTFRVALNRLPRLKGFKSIKFMVDIQIYESLMVNTHYNCTAYLGLHVENYIQQTQLPSVAQVLPKTFL